MHKINNDVINHLYSKIEEIERPLFEHWQKRLVREPIVMLDDNAKKEQTPNRNFLNNMVDLEEIDKENYKEAEKSLQKKLASFEKSYRQTGKDDPIRRKEIDDILEENRLEGRLYSQIEEKYNKLKKEIKRLTLK
ncbi:hypothetical protein FJZ53_02470 [Candidatus Woesearchaeota archaeon]|nr:hypothetical protein [Candidatus Woesearchaeota archaeon]